MTPEWARMLEKYQRLEAIGAELGQALRELAQSVTTLEAVTEIIERQRIAQAEFDDCWERGQNGRLQVKGGP